MLRSVQTASRLCRLRLLLLCLLCVLLVATTTGYLLGRTCATNIAITLNCCTRNCYCYELYGSVIKSALIFYHLEFKSSITSPCATPVLVEIWIIPDLLNMSQLH